MPTCDRCGKEFDTERGVKVHASQVHPDDTASDDTADDTSGEDVDTVEKEADMGPITFSLTIRHALVVTFAVGVLFGGFGMAALYGMDGGTGAIAAPTQNPSDSGGSGAEAPQDPSGTDSGDGGVDMSQIDMSNQPTMGSDDAPVTLVMYEDYECPFCQRFEQQALSQIVSNYVDSGQVKIVWKDFPLTRIHPWAQPAAETMECVYREAGDDVFWPVKNKIFANQNALSTSNVQQQIIDWAAQEGASKAAIQSCLENEDPGQAVSDDMQEGRNLGVSGTPTVIVAGQKIVGAQPYSAFQQVIDSALGN